MKKFVIISLVLCPLLAGCSSHFLRLNANGGGAQNHKHSGVQSQLKKLRWRVSKLNKRVAAQARRTRARASGDREVAAATSGSDIEKRVAQINTKLNQLADSQNLIVAAQEDDRATARKKLDSLEDKLKTIEVALTAQSTATKAGGAPSPGAHDQAIVARLVRLEAAIKETGEKQSTLNSDLEKDRTLVIDYLEDLDSRLAKLEKPSTASPPAPSQKP